MAKRHDPLCPIRRWHRMHFQFCHCALIREVRADERREAQLDLEQRLMRDERATGWDRAHTMLCPNVPCRKHRNPWQRRRAGRADEQERVNVSGSSDFDAEMDDLYGKVEALPGNDPFQSPERRAAYEYAIENVLDLLDGAADD